MFAEIFVLLYLGHLAADYPLQTDHQAAHKAGKGWAGWRANLAHTGTHVALCGAGLMVGVVVLGWTISPLLVVAALAWIGASHAFVDRRWPVAWWMEHTRQAAFAQHGGAAHVDQTAHLIALAVAALAMAA